MRKSSLLHTDRECGIILEKHCMERTNTMNALDIMKRPAAYVSGYENTPTEEQNRAKQLCWEYNRTAPNEQEKRRSILQTLLGTLSLIHI